MASSGRRGFGFLGLVLSLFVTSVACRDAGSGADVADAESGAPIVERSTVGPGEIVELRIPKADHRRIYNGQLFLTNSTRAWGVTLATDSASAEPAHEIPRATAMARSALAIYDTERFFLKVPDERGELELCYLPDEGPCTRIVVE